MKTAMQELLDFITKNQIDLNGPLCFKIIELLEKEKEQIIKAWDERAKPYPYENDENWQVLDCTGEFYYNQTYNHP